MRQAIISFSSSLFYLESQCICSPLKVSSDELPRHFFIPCVLSCRLRYCTCNTYMSERVQGSAVGQGRLCAGEKRVMTAPLNLITQTVNSHSIIYLWGTRSRTHTTPWVGKSHYGYATLQLALQSDDCRIGRKLSWYEVWGHGQMFIM